MASRARTITLMTLSPCCLYFADLLPDCENAFVFITYPIENSFLTYPFVVVKESEIKKQRFIEDVINAFEMLKDSDDQVYFALMQLMALTNILGFFRISM